MSATGLTWHLRKAFDGLRAEPMGQLDRAERELRGCADHADGPTAVARFWRRTGIIPTPSTMTRQPGDRLGPYEILPLSARAAWARSTARATRGCAATSRSRSCRRRPPPIPTGSPVRAGGLRRRRAEPPEHPGRLRRRRRTTARPTSSRSCSRARRCASGSARGALRRARPSSTRPRSPTVSPRRTRRASSTATSSPRTSSSPTTDGSRSSTSAWPS